MPADPRNARTYSIDGHRFSAARLPAGLHVVATPIGNLNDITLRALQTLSAVDVIYCEDTRVSSRLLARYEINTTLKPYHDHNAAKQRPRILAALHDGAAVALISDAGTPLVSDPGYKLVSACQAEDIPIDAVPGPSAALTALALAGLPSDQFRFCGFPPARPGARKAWLRDVAAASVTAILYESPRRVTELLSEISEIMPASRVVICRELTKLHQEVLRGSPADLMAQLAGRPALKGEVTLAVSPGAAEGPAIDSPVVQAELLTTLSQMPPAKAASRIARQFSLKKSEVYDLAMKLKQHPASND